MPGWLDQNTDLLDWVAANIDLRNVEDTGRKDLSVESMLRCAFLKQYRQMTYEDVVPGAGIELARHFLPRNFKSEYVQIATTTHNS